jgi:DedD protein
MPLPSFLERFRRGANGATQGARAPSPSDVEALRTRARRRLIGMVVLVGAGLLGLPWLFETQPRPMSPDVRIVQAGQPTPVEADVSPRTASGRVAQVVNISPPAEPSDTPSTSAQATSAADARPAVSPKSAGAVVPRPSEKVDAKPAEERVEKIPEKAAEKAAQKAPLKPADKKPDAKTEGKSGDVRYVVQFGAFADVNAAREARQKAERMGLKTYAQQVETPQGKRIRVRLGPFADKAEADKALATLRKGGLNGNVLTL